MRVVLAFALLLIAGFCFAGDFDDYEAAFESESPPTNTKVEAEEPSPVEDNAPAHDYDEEEFEGFEDITVPVGYAAPAANTQQGAAPAAEKAKSQVKSWKDLDWTIEISYGVIIALYVVNLFVGKYTNASMAKAWLKQYLDLYRSNFYLVGHGDDLIVQESNSSYTLKATGRVHCSGCHTDITLKKRHDLLAILWNFLYPSHDSVTITFPMNQSEMNPFVFAIVATSARSAFIKSHDDMAIANKKSCGLPSNLECYTDCAEVTSLLLNSEILSVIKEHSDLIEWIYITDIHPEYVHTNIFQVQFKIPSDVKKMEKLMRLTFLLVDFIPSLQLSKLSLASLQRVRKKMQEQATKETNIQRQERLTAKKEEEKKEMMAKMSPEELEKYKEKQEKKRMRKLISKQSKKVVAMG